MIQIYPFLIGNSFPSMSCFHRPLLRLVELSIASTSWPWIFTDVCLDFGDIYFSCQDLFVYGGLRLETGFRQATIINQITGCAQINIGSCFPSLHKCGSYIYLLEGSVNLIKELERCGSTRF